MEIRILEKRRNFRRKESRIPIMYSIEDGFDTTDKGEISINISHGGLYFSSVEKIPVNTLLKLKLFIVKRTVRCRGQVVWTRKDKKLNIWHMGIEFIGLDQETKAQIFNFSGLKRLY